MIQRDVHEARAELPRLLERVARGETVVIRQDDAPIAELRPIPRQPAARRPLGLGRGQGTVLPEFYACTEIRSTGC
jgi:antitoxin (DNA-binding transcriptional repressor) of toxin-antitoxin stability system